MESSSRPNSGGTDMTVDNIQLATIIPIIRLADLNVKKHLSRLPPRPRSMRGRVYVRPSARLSVCPTDRPQQRRAAGLLLSALPGGDIDGEVTSQNL